MDKILEELRNSTTQEDLATEEELERQEQIINVFEHIAEHNTNKSVKFILEITAEELNITVEELSAILDKYYTEEDNE